MSKLHPGADAFIANEWEERVGGRRRIMTIYLIKRGPRPDHHRAPYHPVVICDRKDMAKWEVGWTGDRAWLWSHCEPGTLGGGWLLERWEGLDLDYGGLVKGGTLPDGTHMGFFHKQRDRGYAPRTGDDKPVWLGYDETLQEPWTLLPGAVWWSAMPMSKALQEAGVVYPSDSFTQQRILDGRAMLDDEKAKRGGVYGTGTRICPEWWPKAEALP